MSLSNAFPKMTSHAAGISGAVVLLVSGCLSGTSIGGESQLCLTRDGKPAASIVISASPRLSAIVAVIELRDHIKKITGAELPIISDTNEVKGARILVGESAATRALGLKSADFKTQEYMIDVCKEDLVLMGRDADTPPPRAINDFGKVQISQDMFLSSLLFFFQDHGSCDAVHEFLERDCGVRWYAPTELGTVFVKQPTLTVKIATLRRTPAFSCRYFRLEESVAEGRVSSENGMFAVLNHPNQLEASLWMLRMKFGGRQTVANHGLYSFYDRFWEKNPNNPGVFEGEHPEYFAKGYKGLPQQLCYSSTAVVAQVAQDISGYFQTGRNPGLNAGTDWVSVEPMDNESFCKCDACRRWFPGVELGKKTPEDVFSSGKFSDYIFQFANAVQKEVSKTCPTGHVFVLAYGGHGFPPSFPVDPKIYVGPCINPRGWLSPGDPAAFNAWVKQEMKNPRAEVCGYKAWTSEKKHSGRLLSMWVYDCFPLAMGDMLGYHAFPAYHVHTLANQLQMFARDGIDGIFGCGIGEQLETYITLKYMDNPDRNIDALLDEFFASYYGAAGAPLKRVYALIEETYADHANYPPEFIKSPGHQTEEIAWKYLGTQERMDKMAKWMEEARAAKLSDTERQRVDLFDKGPWQYMVEGRKQWLFKSKHGGEVEALKKAPPPTAQAPSVPDAGGNLTKVDWAKAGSFTVAHTHEGYPSERPIAVEIAHDANYLYLRLSDPVARDKVKPEGGVFDGDRWEIFVAARRAVPEYIQFGIKPDGRIQCNTNPGCSVIETAAKVKCRLDDKGWVTELAVPLSLVRAFPQASAETIYLNLYRPASRGQSTLAWSPNFAGNGYNTSARLGAVTLGK